MIIHINKKKRYSYQVYPRIYDISIKWCDHLLFSKFIYHDCGWWLEDSSCQGPLTAATSRASWGPWGSFWITSCCLLVMNSGFTGLPPFFSHFHNVFQGNVNMVIEVRLSWGYWCIQPIEKTQKKDVLTAVSAMWHFCLSAWSDLFA
jgi:hypothetical protein